MGTKRLFTVILAVILSAVCFDVPVYAHNADPDCDGTCGYEDEEEFDSFYGFSWFEFEEVMSTDKEKFKEAGFAWKGAGDWIDDYDGLYVPVGYDVHTFVYGPDGDIFFTSSKKLNDDTIDMSFTLPDLKDDKGFPGFVTFTQYMETVGADNLINLLKKEDPNCKGKRVKYRNTELLIYDKKDTECDDYYTEYSYIFWTENGHTFSLTTNCDPRSTDVLEYTRYRKVRFNQGLVQRDGKMIYLDKNGNMIKIQGWKTISDRKYYFKEDGTAVKDGKTIIGDKMYVFGKYAECEGAYTGWQSTKDGKRYYTDGKYVTGTQTIDGKKYTFDKNGYLK